MPWQHRCAALSKLVETTELKPKAVKTVVTSYLQLAAATSLPPHDCEVSNTLKPKAVKTVVTSAKFKLGGSQAWPPLRRFTGRFGGLHRQGQEEVQVEVICLGGDLQCTLLEDGEFIGPRTTPSRHSNGSVRQLLVSEFCVKWKLRAVNTWPAGTHYNNRWKARTQIDYILVTDSAGGSGGVVVHWPLLRLNEDHRPVAAKGFKSQIETEKQPLQYSMKGWKPCTDEADEEYKQGVLHSVGVAESVDMTGVHEAIGEVASPDRLHDNIFGDAQGKDGN
jgi:hypothetical protein